MLQCVKVRFGYAPAVGVPFRLFYSTAFCKEPSPHCRVPEVSGLQSACRACVTAGQGKRCPHAGFHFSQPEGVVMVRGELLKGHVRRHAALVYLSIEILYHVRVEGNVVRYGAGSWGLARRKRSGPRVCRSTRLSCLLLSHQSIELGPRQAPTVAAGSFQ